MVQAGCNMNCSKCNRDIKTSHWPYGWTWLQVANFSPDEIPIIDLEERRPYYLLCPICKEELLGNLKAYKTVVTKEVVPF